MSWASNNLWVKQAPSKENSFSSMSSFFDDFINNVPKSSPNSSNLKRKDSLFVEPKPKKISKDRNNLQRISIDAMSVNSFSSFSSSNYKQLTLDSFFVKNKPKNTDLNTSIDKKMKEIEKWTMDVSQELSQNSSTCESGIKSKSRSFELFINDICTPRSAVTIATQTDFQEENSMNLSTLCMQCSQNVADSFFNSYNFRSSLQIRNINYSEARSVYSGHYSIQRRNVVTPHVNISDFQKDFNTLNAEDWLERCFNNFYNLVFPKKVPRAPIFVNIDKIKKSVGNVTVLHYFDGDLKVYRIDKVRLIKVVKNLDGEDFVNVLTQESVEDDLYTEAVLSPLPLPSSYTNFDNNDFFDSLLKQNPSNYDTKLIKGFINIAKNNNFILKETDLGDYDKKILQKMIKQMLDGIFDAWSKELSPFFNIRNNEFVGNACVVNNRIEMKPFPDCKMKKICYNYICSKRKFLIMMYVLKKLLILLQTDTKITKRELYYQVKHLLKTQGELDKCLSEISILLNVGQWELNILSSHGLVYGNMKLVLTNKEVTNCNVPGTLIPFDVDSIVEIKSNALFILVVEKESIFQKLLVEDLPNRLKVPFVMITGKGHPDFNTKLFVNRLAKIMKLPVFILVDADVHGIKIMMEYRFGCLRSSYISREITVPNAKWLGVFPSEIQKLNMKKTKLTQTDRKMLTNLLQSPILQSHPEIIKELKVLQTTNEKASIEGLLKNNTFLSQSYLPTKFFNQDFH